MIQEQTNTTMTQPPAMSPVAAPSKEATVIDEKDEVQTWGADDVDPETPLQDEPSVTSAEPKKEKKEKKAKDPAKAKAPAKEKSASKSKKKEAEPVAETFDVNVADVVVDTGVNPRKNFDRETLRALAADIKNNGQINPITLYSDETDGKYHLIAGERRLRAAKLVGWKTLKATVLVVRKSEDDDGLIADLRCSENLERDDLTPLEMARSIQQVIGKKVLVDGKLVVATAKIFADKRKKSSAWVSQRLALLDLPKQIQDALDSGKLQFSHARELIGLGNAEQQLVLYKELMAGDGGPDVATAKRAVAKARRGESGKGKRGRPTASGDLPSARQNLDVALERLQAVKITIRKVADVRDGLAQAYEKYDKAQTEEKKSYFKGVISAMEWGAGFRDSF